MIISSKLPNALPGEKVIKIIRKSIFVLLKDILLAMFISILPVALYGVFLITNPGIWNGALSWPLTVLCASAYSLFIWLFIFFSFVDFYLDVWIITDRRIIDMKQEGFFSRTVSEQNIEKVQDITSEIKGALHTIFNFGNLFVQTAGEVERIAFQNIPNPNGVREIVMELVEKHKCENKL